MTIDVSDLPPVDAHPVVYQCDVRQEFADDPTSRAAISAFLEAHGVNPLSLMIGVMLYVRRRPDGTFYLDLWRAVGNVDAMQAPYSTECFRCIKQERIAVPLAAPVPVFADAFITDRNPPPSVVTGPIWPRREINLDPRTEEVLRRIAEAEEYDTPDA